MGLALESEEKEEEEKFNPRVLPRLSSAFFIRVVTLPNAVV